MATISASLTLFDKFSRKLNEVNRTVDSTVRNVERLSSAMGASTTLNLNIGRLVQQTSVSELRSQLSMLISGLGSNNLQLYVDLNTTNAIIQATALRTQIISRVGTITAKIQLKLQSTLNTLLTTLITTVERLRILVNRLLNGGRGPGPGPGPDRGGLLSGGLGGLFGGLQGILAGYLGYSGIKNLMGSTIGAAAQQQLVEDMFVARTGSEQVGESMFTTFKQDALAAGQDVVKTLQGTLSFFSVTQNTDQLRELNRLISQMSAFDTAGNGIEGAASALKAAMNGDIVSLIGRFNMSKSDIQGFKIDELGKAGDVDGFIQAFDKLLEKQRMGREAYDKMMQSPINQVEALRNNLNSAFADLGTDAMKSLLPLIKLLNDAFKAGKFDKFFGAIKMGLALIAGYAKIAVPMIVDNLDILKNALIAIGIVSTAIATTMAIQWLIAWGTAATPILLVIAAVLALLIILDWMGISFGEMIAATVGYGYMVKSSWDGMINHIKNGWTTWSDYFYNVMVDPVGAVVKLFFDMGIHILETIAGVTTGMRDLFKGVIKSFVDNINILLGHTKTMVAGMSKSGVLDLFGIDLSIITDIPPISFDEDDYNFNKIVDNSLEYLKEKKANFMKDNPKLRDTPLLPKLYDEDHWKAFDEGYNSVMKFWEENNLDKEALQKILDDWNEKQNEINKIDEVGKVNEIGGTVDISSEDIKYMRDLAEIKAIQNFVSLTPQVNVTTGPVMKTVDTEEMVRKIVEGVELELTASAKGVYGV